MTAGLVEWREWGEEAFAEAREKDRLILLDISAVWCHWCHVMDETSYSDPEVAGLINGSLVPVRVDNDRMPDVNERYNMGGWPTTAFLVPSGEVLLGATYVPPDKLKQTITDLLKFYREHREHLDERIMELAAEKQARLREALAEPLGDMPVEAPEFVLGQLEANYDEQFGGFGDAPKFPVPETLDLLLSASHETGDRKYLRMAAATMRGMSSFGMYDHVMGGFFRYSVTRDWSVPHFEKMTESNAGLIVSYIDAYRLTKDDVYLETVRSALDYVDEWLWHPDGYFRGSQDADETYYGLSMEERMKLPAPFLDDTAYVNLNAKMAVAYMTAWEALDEPEYIGRALTALYFMLGRMKREGGGYFHYHDGEPRRSGLLTDQAAMLGALLSAYQATGDRKWLNEAAETAGYMESELMDKDRGGFYDTRYDPEALGALSHRTKPFMDNSEAARAFKLLSVLTGEGRYEDVARRAILSQSRGYAEYGFMASGYALAVESLAKPVTEVSVIGRRGSDDVHALLREVYTCYIPRRVVRILDVERDAEEVAKMGYHTDGAAAAYICAGRTCSARIDDPDGLSAALSCMKKE